MSEFYGMAGSVPMAKKWLGVTLAHPYSRVVREAVMLAIGNTMADIMALLITSAGSPIPMDTGNLRAHTRVDIKPDTGGVNLILAWPDVVSEKGFPYAQWLVEQAGAVQVRHAKDPLAENPWMEASMRVVFPIVMLAFQRALDALGIEYTVHGGVP